MRALLERERRHVLLAFIAVTLLGLVVKFAVSGHVGGWCKRYGAAILYEVFWILLLRLVRPGLKVWVCGTMVCIATCGLEFLQLHYHPKLVRLNRTLSGTVLLGSSFDPLDFVYYVVGSMAGVFLLIVLSTGALPVGGDGVRRKIRLGKHEDGSSHSDNTSQTK